MASQDFLVSRSYAAENKVGRVIDDTPVVLRIKNLGPTTTTPTVVLSDTSSLLTLTDSNGAVAIDLSQAAYSTVGEVADYINGQTYWSCKVLDALRADNSNDKWVNGSVTAAVINGETVFDVLQDTSALAEYQYRVTYDRNVDLEKPSGSHRVTLKKITYYADLTVAANKIRVYEWDNANKTETQIWGATPVDTTETSHDLGDGITASEGNDLIVVVTGTVVDHASGFLQCQYKRE